jgi:hypothetical protein
MAMSPRKMMAMSKDMAKAAKMMDGWRSKAEENERWWNGYETKENAWWWHGYEKDEKRW